MLLLTLMITTST